MQLMHLWGMELLSCYLPLADTWVLQSDLFSRGVGQHVQLFVPQHPFRYADARLISHLLQSSGLPGNTFSVNAHYSLQLQRLSGLHV